MNADLWLRGCELLAAELPEQQFNTWIRPLPAAEVTDQGTAGTVVTLRVPNRFKLDWIRNQYAGRIEAVLTHLAGKPVRLDITLALRDGAPAAPLNGAASDTQARPATHTPLTTASSAAANPSLAGSHAPGERPALSMLNTPVPSRSRLNPRPW